LTLFLKINILFQLLEIQQNYHKKALEEIEKKLPKMKDALGNSR
jgi:predicted metal-dependent phosphoesterase TrpH